jgi:hypothetical protein
LENQHHNKESGQDALAVRHGILLKLTVCKCYEASRGWHEG